MSQPSFKPFDIVYQTDNHSKQDENTKYKTANYHYGNICVFRDVVTSLASLAWQLVALFRDASGTD